MNPRNYKSILRLYYYNIDKFILVNTFTIRDEYNHEKEHHYNDVPVTDYKLRLIKKYFNGLGYRLKFNLNQSKKFIKVTRDKVSCEISLDFYNRDYMDKNLFDTLMALKRHIEVANEMIHKSKDYWEDVKKSFKEILKEDNFDTRTVGLSKDGSALICTKLIKYPVDEEKYKDYDPTLINQSIDKIHKSLKDHGMYLANFKTLTEFCITYNKSEEVCTYMAISWIYKFEL